MRYSLTLPLAGWREGAKFEHIFPFLSVSQFSLRGEEQGADGEEVISAPEEVSRRRRTAPLISDLALIRPHPPRLVVAAVAKPA